MFHFTFFWGQILNKGEGSAVMSSLFLLLNFSFLINHSFCVIFSIYFLFVCCFWVCIKVAERLVVKTSSFYWFNVKFVFLKKIRGVCNFWCVLTLMAWNPICSTFACIFSFVVVDIRVRSWLFCVSYHEVNIAHSFVWILLAVKSCNIADVDLRHLFCLNFKVLK